MLDTARAAAIAAGFASAPGSIWIYCHSALHPAGGTPDTFMRADVLERRVERADTMWLAGDELVHRDRHDARHGFALAIQRVELALLHRLDFGDRHLDLEIIGIVVVLHPLR